MKTKELKINIPEGYEIDKENSTFECIKFKPIKKALPKTWEVFCEIYPRRRGESWIDDISQIQNIYTNECSNRRCIEDKNLLPNEKYAEAILALCQLIQLRDCYNDGWRPDFNDISSKYHICVYKNEVNTGDTFGLNRILIFKSAKLRDQFLENFKDLIEIAKPLL